MCCSEHLTAEQLVANQHYHISTECIADKRTHSSSHMRIMGISIDGSGIRMLGLGILALSHHYVCIALYCRSAIENIHP